MQKFFGLAVLLTILGSAVCAPRSEAGPIRKVIMAKKIQKKQEQKQEQTQSGGGTTSKSTTKTKTTGSTETTTTK
jgi:hypothetical protein